MKKTIALFSCLFASTYVFVPISYAQLLNYDRLRSRLKAKAEISLQKEEEAEGKTVLPRWRKKAPLVTTRLERRYDINRDGKLQTAEVKMYLRDTVKTIEEKGGIIVNSDILLEYDTNEDGVVSLKEIARLKKDAGLPVASDF